MKVFSQKDYEDISSNLIPVLVGADYGEYIKKRTDSGWKYKVIGVLEEGAVLFRYRIEFRCRVYG